MYCNFLDLINVKLFLLLSVMLAKTLRVHLVVNSKMKKMKIKTHQVVGFTAVLIAVMVVLLILLTPLNPIDATYTDDYAITGQLHCPSPCLSSILMPMPFDLSALLLHRLQCFYILLH